MFSKGDLGNLMKHVQKMQDKIQQIQQEISEIEVIGESGAGLVKVTINGTHHCRRVELDPKIMEDGKDVLEDLITAAFNDAERRITEVRQKKMTSISSGMSFPAGFDMSF